MALEILLPSEEETKVVIHVNDEEAKFDMGDILILIEEAYEIKEKSKDNLGHILAGLIESQHNIKMNSTQASVLLNAVTEQMYMFKKKSLILPSSTEEQTQS